MTVQTAIIDTIIAVPILRQHIDEASSRQNVARFISMLQKHCLPCSLVSAADSHKNLGVGCVELLPTEQGKRAAAIDRMRQCFDKAQFGHTRLQQFQRCKNPCGITALTNHELRERQFRIHREHGAFAHIGQPQAKHGGSGPLADDRRLAEHDLRARARKPRRWTAH